MRKVVIYFCIGISVCVMHAEPVHKSVNPPRAFARGMANIMTCWLELPRGIIYENARIPLVGFVSGSVKGAVLTTGRVGAGVLDVVAMGLTRDGLHSSIFPEFVWDAQWIPACGEDIVQESEDISVSPCKNIENPRPFVSTVPQPEPVSFDETPYYITMTEEMIMQEPAAEEIEEVSSASTTFSSLNDEEDMHVRMKQLETDVQRIEELARLLGRK